MGRPDPAHAIAGQLGAVGAVRPRCRARDALQVRGPRGRRQPAAARRSAGHAHRGPARDRVGRVRGEPLLAGRRLDGAPRRRGGPARPDVDLRGAPGLVARPDVVARPRRAARRARHRARVHPRGAHGRAGAPVRGFLGLPGHRLLRADRPVRRARRLPCPRRRAAPARHRRHRRLGAGALPARRVGPGPLRRHRALRARRPASRVPPRLGNADLQLRPDRGAQLPARERGYLGAGLPRRRAPGRRGGVHALPRLLPRARPVAAQRARRAREPRRRRLPAGAQRRRARRGARRRRHRRGVDRVARRDRGRPATAVSGSA